MITENKYYSYNTGHLPAGCQQCVRGEKLVLFVTGFCPRRCYFCPVSDQKFNHDATFANERKVDSPADLFLEVQNMDAKGTGITGGDPLMKLSRTAEYIRTLKEKFGKDFHIHLYTSLNLVTQKALELLSQAGLDEIRFHLDLDDRRFWKNLEQARAFPWKVGVELPVLPHKQREMKEVVDYCNGKIDFLNLNELEIADNSQSQLSTMGFTTKDKLSYAVTGSLELGLQLIQYVQEKRYSFPIHLCTAKLKDAVQLANRLKREARQVKRPFDRVSTEGLLTRGALYWPDLAPGFGYRRNLETADKNKFLLRLEPLLALVKEHFQLAPEYLYVDRSKPRILLAANLIKKHKKWFKTLGLLPAIVTEYPTADQLEIEVEFL